MKGKKAKIASILLAGSMIFLPSYCRAEAEPLETAAENGAVESVSERTFPSRRKVGVSFCLSVRPRPSFSRSAFPASTLH